MKQSFEEKNKNILSRFEANNSGTIFRKYSVTLKDSKKFIMICMNGQTLEQAKDSCESRFGDRLDYVKA